MTTIKTPEEIKILREGGKILASALNEVVKKVISGVTTMEIDVLAEKLIRQAGGEPSFKNYGNSEGGKPFPASLCVSINDEIVHGIPSGREFVDGDIVGLDFGMKFQNLYTDMAVTVPVGEISSGAKRLIQNTRLSLEDGIKTIKEGSFLGDIGFAVQSRAEKEGFSVIKDLVGHGVGYAVHEDPYIPNYGKKGAGEILKEGMVLAIEPMLSMGSPAISLTGDKWTYKTQDGSLSAHFEHTIAVTKDGVDVLTKV